MLNTESNPQNFISFSKFNRVNQLNPKSSLGLPRLAQALENMDHITNFGDERQTFNCAFCGGETESRDHVPSKVFLDKPYPEQLPVVPSCNDCNNGFSIDEEYLACLLESVKAGTTETNKIK